MKVKKKMSVYYEIYILMCMLLLGKSGIIAKPILD